MPSNFECKARRKTQTKLTFDPLVSEKSSSPATKMSPAKVRYQLPTPVKSSQTPGGGRSGRGGLDGLEDDDSATFSRQTSRDDRGNTSSDEEDDFITPVREKRQPRKAPSAFRSLREKTKKQEHISLSDDSEDEDESDDDEDDEDERALVTPKAKQSGRSKVNGEAEDEEIRTLTYKSRNLVVPDEEDEEDRSPVASIVRRRSRPSLVIPDDDDEEIPLLPKSQRATTKSERARAGTGKNIIKLDEGDDEDDDDDDVIISSPSKRRHSMAITDDEDDDESAISPLKRRKQDMESDDSDIVSSPTKRFRHVATEEDEDDESDAPRGRTYSRESKSKSSLSPVTSSRYTRQARPKQKHRTAKEKAAELLRRKRAGEKIDQLTESSSDGESGRGIYDSDPELQVLDHFEDEESSPETARQAAAPSSGRTDRNRAVMDEDEDFIVDDDEDYPLGVPEMPLQFSRRAHKPLKDNFADCVEWLIHNNIDPNFPERREERYSHAFKKVDDEARGYAISTFISSQWTAEFTAAIKARPILTMRGVGDGEGITAEGVPRCDACNHRNHPPKYALSFRGEPYNKKTLEDVEQDSDYENDDDDAVPIDEDGNELVPAGTEWFSGRDCSDKAFQGHKLIHWRHSLNQAVIEILEDGRHLTERKIAKRAAATADERWAYADEVVQAWTADGTIHGLYREFKQMMDTARTFEPRRYGR